MAKQITNIQMRLLSVNEVRFMMSPDRISDNLDPSELQMCFSNQIEPDVNNDTISIVFGIRYLLKDDIVLESIYRYSFSVIDLAKYIKVNGDNTLTISHIMPHFLSVAVGTMRGILIVKTAGTNFSKYPLPIIDINALNDSLSSLK